jgi:NADPH:quinone reductase-like Zn-dependent oxidoreductase
MEGAGEVVKVGAGVTAFKPGDRVMGRCAGAFSEYALMDAARGDRDAREPLVGGRRVDPAHVPRRHDMLVLQGRLKANEWLLVTGVSSGVGVASLQAAKAWARSDRHLGLAGEARQLKAEGLGRGARHACRRVPRRGDEGDRRQGRDLS